MQSPWGGLGLNLQDASAVILMEPQLKPSSEEQAVSRAHRMGQSRTVVVHRLFASNTVDTHLEEVLAKKQAEFDNYAEHSSIKEASPEAIAVDDSLEIVAMEQARLCENAPV